MSLYNSFDKGKHLSELDEPYDSGQEAVLTPAQRRAAVLGNLANTTMSATQLAYLAGTTAGQGDESKAVVLGSDGGFKWPTGPTTQSVIMEDFHGAWLDTDAWPADHWSTTAGAGTANAKATTVANSINGEVTIKTSSDDGTNAQNTSTFTGLNLGYKANKGGLICEARIKVDVITGVCIFVGFTDTISTTVELPIFMNAADIDSDATDACGVVFDTDATTDGWTVGGVANGTDTAPTIGAVSPVADTYTVIRVEVSAAGAVSGYVDGVLIGTVASAVTTTVALTPAVFVSARSAAQKVLTMDYIWVAQNR